MAKIASTSLPKRRSHTADYILRVDSVEKLFGMRSILNGVSLFLRRSEVMAVCGSSGCGKTTLLRIICGLTQFDAGRLIIGDEIISAGSVYPAELYGRIGMVFQDHNLFPHMTAIGNVTLALRERRRLAPSEARERGMAELHRMGVATLADRYPVSLSGGEKQRVAIARALAMDPLLLLLDEPTAQLDTYSVHEVCERILDLANIGTTMLVVTHNITFAVEVATTYALLQDGTCYVSKESTIFDYLRFPWR